MAETVYNAKTLDRWHQLLALKYPNGDLFRALTIEDTNMYYLLRSKAITYQQLDTWIAEKLNGLILSADSPYLNEYWDMLGISKFLAKPSDTERMYTIIKAFAYAKNGLITFEQIEDFISDVFGEEISVENVYNAEDVAFAYTLPLTFYGTDAIFTAIIEFTSETSEDATGLPYTLPFVLKGNRYRDVIKAILEEVIDINFKVVYKNG